MIDFTQSNDFDFFVPITISKSQRQDSKDQKRWIEGIASTVHKDLQAESVYQKGIDFSYFIKFGYFNNDHKPGFDNKVGQPTEVKVTNDGLWVKGFLFQNHKIADSIWELSHAIEASGSDRKLGFSIQGKVVKRAGSRIIKCWVQDIAITAAPINTNTWLDVVKSLQAIDGDQWCEGDYGVIYPEDSMGKAIPCDTKCKNSCKECVCGKKDSSLSEVEMDLKKDVGGIGSKKDDSEFHAESLASGTGVEKEHTKDSKIAEKIAKDHLEEDPNYYTKLKEMEAEKALTASGSVLVPESLDKKEKDQGFGKALDFNQVVWVLADAFNISSDDAVILAKGALEMNNLLSKGE